MATNMLKHKIMTGFGGSMKKRFIQYYLLNAVILVPLFFLWTEYFFVMLISLVGTVVFFWTTYLIFTVFYAADIKKEKSGEFMLVPAAVILFFKCLFSCTQEKFCIFGRCNGICHTSFAL